MAGQSFNDWIVTLGIRVDAASMRTAQAQIRSQIQQVVALSRADVAAARAETARANSRRAANAEMRSRISLQREQLRLDRDQARQQQATQQRTDQDFNRNLSNLNRQLAFQRRMDAQRRSEERASIAAANRAQSITNRATRLTTSQLSASDSLARAQVRSSILPEAQRSGFESRIASLHSRVAGTTNEAEMGAARREVRNLTSEINRAASAQDRLNREMSRGGFAAGAMSGSMMNMARSYISIFAVIEGARRSFTSAAKMQGLSNTMLMASGSREQAATDKGVIIAKARETGLDLEQVMRMFNSVIASARDAKMTKAEQGAIFEGITTASVAYGLDTEQQKFAAKAFSQMIGKQVIMAEELRGQLQEHLPAVMGPMMKAAGINPEDKDAGKKLEKMMRAGKLDLEVFKKFVNIITEKGKATGAFAAGINSMTAAAGRLQTELTLTNSAIWDTFLTSSTTNGLNNFADVMRNIGEYVKAIGDKEKTQGIIGWVNTLKDFFILAAGLSKELDPTMQILKFLTGGDSAEGPSLMDKMLAKWQMWIGYLQTVLDLSTKLGKNPLVQMILPDAQMRTGVRQVMQASGVSQSTQDAYTGFAGGPLGGILRSAEQMIPGAYPIRPDRTLYPGTPGQGTVLNATFNIDGSKDPTLVTKMVNDSIGQFFQQASPSKR